MSANLEALAVGKPWCPDDAAYIVDLSRFSANLKDFGLAFQVHYPLSRIAYSVKTNYTPVLCRAALDANCLLEVVSEMEYDLAIRLEASPQRIVVNGPCKSQTLLERCLPAGALVNLDGLPDLEILDCVARSYPNNIFRVGLRCNLPFPHEPTSRFGFDASDPNTLLLIADRIRMLPNVRLVGIHGHYCFAKRTVDDYRSLTTGLLSLAKQLFPEGAPEFINVGGGFFSRMPPQMSQQFADTLPDFRDYGAAIAVEFSRAFGTNDHTYLLTEPGVAVVADVMQFETRVVDVRKIGNRELILVAGSVYNIKPTKSRRNLPLRIVRASDAKLSSARTKVINADVVGSTCMEDDVLHVGFRGEVARSDVAIFENVGAYTLVLKPPFINPCPPVYCHSPSSNALPIAKRKESLDDIFATYVFPGEEHMTIGKPEV